MIHVGNNDSKHNGPTRRSRAMAMISALTAFILVLVLRKVYRKIMINMSSFTTYKFS